MQSTIPEPLESLAKRQAEQWLERCAEFREWEREHVFLEEPSSSTVQEHRRTLRYMISMTRMMLNAISDPEWHDTKLFSSLEGALWQFNNSWEMVQNPLAEEQLNAALARHFPG